MSDHARLGWIALLTILGLLLYMAVFGEGLLPRPADYTPIDYLSASCQGVGTDTTVFRFGVGGDPRWAEIYVEDRPGHQQLVAVASYAPGVDGKLIVAEVLLPSGQIVRFHSADELRNSQFVEVCQVAAAWLKRM